MTRSALSAVAMVNLLLFSSGASAAEANCGGLVSWVVADHAQCGGNIGFKTDASGGMQGKWLCTKTKEGGSVVLAAIVAGRPVRAYVEVGDVGGLCSQVPHFRQIIYIIIDP